MRSSLRWRIIFLSAFLTFTASSWLGIYLSAISPLSSIAVAFLYAALAAVFSAVIMAIVVRPLSKIIGIAARYENQFSPGSETLSDPRRSQDELDFLSQLLARLASQVQEGSRALAFEQSKAAAILQDMSDGVIVVNSLGKILLLNPAAEAMFSIRLTQAHGVSLAEAIRHFQVVEMWRACLESGKVQSSVIEIRAEKLYLQGAAAALQGGDHGEMLLLFQNLTRQRYLETVRRDFVSNISHELRTPLASLKALTETLQAGALEDPPAARRFLALIETEVDALSQMVGELLELSRIESGRVPLQLRPTPPLEIIAHAVDRLRLQVERAQLQIVITCPTDLPPVLADPPRLQQVMVNLLHNAIKFT
ncbi:MAG: cell wall metabolism sensor histidine kinase WalK, partial [Chloroflexi bacterium]|nr:cell wall metabolism sensor histidine kinase WalK [Chloroflexota bacterium]